MKSVSRGPPRLAKVSCAHGHILTQKAIGDHVSHSRRRDGSGTLRAHRLKTSRLSRLAPTGRVAVQARRRFTEIPNGHLRARLLLARTHLQSRQTAVDEYHLLARENLRKRAARRPRNTHIAPLGLALSPYLELPNRSAHRAGVAPTCQGARPMTAPRTLPIILPPLPAKF